MLPNPWYVGQLGPAWVETLITDSGAANLTGLTDSQVTLTFTNTANRAVITRSNGDGSGGVISIVQASPAIIQYQPCAADVASQVMYHVQVWVAFANGPEPFDCGVWDINPK